MWLGQIQITFFRSEPLDYNVWGTMLKRCRELQPKITKSLAVVRIGDGRLLVVSDL